MVNQKRGYIQRVDAVRTLLMVALILSAYRLPLPLTRYFMLLCNFAPCALFALYGYFVLKPHAKLQKNLLRAGRVLLLLVAAYTVLGSFYQWLYYGRAFSWINMPSLLTFLVFSSWPISLGESIWLIHTVFYALVIFFLCRKLSGHRVLDAIVCGVLLLLGILFGELAGVLHMPFYMERNFLVTTIPYMLLGKLLRDPPEKIKQLSSKKLVLIFCGGVVLCAVEALVLRSNGSISICDHLIGFIPMTAAVVLFAVRDPAKEKVDEQDMRLSSIYRFMYYLYNPVAEFYFILTIFLIGFPNLFNFTAGATAVVAPILTYLLAKVIVKRLIPKLRKSKRKKMKGDALAASLNAVREGNADEKWDVEELAAEKKAEKDSRFAAKEYELAASGEATEKGRKLAAKEYELAAGEATEKSRKLAAKDFGIDTAKKAEKASRYDAKDFGIDTAKKAKKDPRYDAKAFEITNREDPPEIVLPDPGENESLNSILIEWNDSQQKGD